MRKPQRAPHTKLHQLRKGCRAQLARCHDPTGPALRPSYIPVGRIDGTAKNVCASCKTDSSNVGGSRAGPVRPLRRHTHAHSFTLCDNPAWVAAQARTQTNVPWPRRSKAHIVYIHIYIGLHNDPHQVPGRSWLLLLFEVRNVTCANPSALRIRSCSNCGSVVGHMMHDARSLQDLPCAPPTFLGAGTGGLTTHACQHALLRAIASDDHTPGWAW
jgi:hypothetical protein